jgi:hypothetical protein
LDEEPIQTDQEGIIIRFQYRELSQEEIKKKDKIEKEQSKQKRLFDL